MSEVADHRIRIARRLIAVLVVIGLVAVAIIYVPRIASGNYHRAAIERLASDALGREVRIAGPIQLSLLPDPQLRADTVTIGSPKGGLITAATLKLDLAPLPLLLGRLRATRLTLRKPDVSLPWPLPGGATAIAPPLWLASLHATIVDGVFHLGSLTFDHADLSIFTGGPNAVLAASGTLMIDGVTASVTLDIDNTGGEAPAPVRSTIRLANNIGRIDLKGSLDRASTLRGMLDGRLSGTAQRGKIRFHARLIANGAAVALRDIDARVTNPKIGDSSQTTGSAVIALTPAPLLRLDLTGARWHIGAGQTLLHRLTAMVPIAATLDLTDSRMGSIGLPALQANLTDSASGIVLQSLAATLPGAAHVTLARFTSTNGPVTNQVTLTAPNPAATLTSLRGRFPWLPGWPSGIGALTLAGRLLVGTDDRLHLAALHGTLGAKPDLQSAFTGALTVRPSGHHASIAASLVFERLILNPQALASLRAAFMQKTNRVSGPFVLAAHTVVIQRAGAKLPLSGSHLLIDGAIRDTAAGGGVAIALGTLRLGQTFVVGHGARQGDGGIIAARWLITGPNAAAPLAALAQGLAIENASWLALKLWQHPFAASLVAAGPMQAVHTGVTLRLGSIHAAALPVINLATNTATGAVSLRAPSAVALINDLGGAAVLGARDGLDWPGAGSVSLRASGFIGPDRLGLPDFVLSLGALTASGALSLRSGPNPVVTGSIAADTLMIPQSPALLQLAAVAMSKHLTIDLPTLSANIVAQASSILARHALGSLAVNRTVDVAVDRADVAGGTLGGQITLTGGKAPGLTVKAHLQNVDAATVAHDTNIDPTITAGTLDVATNLKAQGSSVADWRRSLSGTIIALGSDLVLNGIDLAAAGAALEQAIASDQTRVGDAGLPQALQSGTTQFDTAALQARVAAGVITLDQGDLIGQAGRITLAGTFDMTRQILALTATAQPTVTIKPPPDLAITLIGPLAHPKVTPKLAPVLGWIAQHKNPSPP